MIKNESTKKVLGNIGWLIFDKLFILLMNLVVIFLIANHYGATEYGLYQYATNIVLILEVIVQLVDGRVVKKEYKVENIDDVVFNTTITKVFLSALALIIGSIILLLSERGNLFRAILFILMIDCIIKNIRFGMENRFEYDLQSKKVVLASNVGLFVSTILQIGAVLVDLEVVYIAIIQMLSSIIILGILYSQYVYHYKNRIKKKAFNKLLMYNIIKESIPLALASAAATVYTRCDSVMLGMMLSTTEVGIYSISSKLISTIQMLIVPIQTTIFIKMIDWFDNKEKYERNYIRITSIMTWIAILGVLLSFIILPEILSLLKPEYLPALDVYKILSVGSIFAYNAILRSSHFTLIKKGNILMITQLITVIINIILNYLFISVWGMNGAALATVISQGLSLFLSNLFFEEAKFVFKCQLKAFNPLNILYK